MTDETKSTHKPKAQTHDDAVKQAVSEAMSPDDKFAAYKEDIERLHAESKVNESGKTVG